MSILVDWQIKDAIKCGDLVVDPFDESLINPCSLDFRLGDRFGKVTPTDFSYGSDLVIDPTRPDSFKTSWEVSNRYVLMPGEFILAMTLEAFEFNNCSAKVMGKSSLGRLGLENSSVAGWVDIGFKANGITLELVNHGQYPILLSKGMKIGQLLLFSSENPNKSYDKVGRYQGQAGSQGSKGV